MNCPNCGKKLVDIVYGVPSLETFQKADRKEIKLGGCVVSPCNTYYHCYDCNIDFSKDLKESVKSDDGWWERVENEE